MTDISWIIIGILVALCGAYFSFGRPLIRSKLSADQIAMLTQFAKVAVQAAEQIIELVTGKDKKAWAMETVKKLLAQVGLTFDEDVVSATIEDQVYEMNKEKNKEPVTGGADE